MNAKLIDLTGQRFGKLLVLEISNVVIGRSPTQHGQRLWRCKCACGRICLIRSGELRYRHQKSCGCEQFKVRHGHARRGGRTKLYQVWNAMVQRCTNPKSQSYPRYGGRGITICERWMRFDNFLMDMGEADGLTLERKDNNGPYAPWNCIWAPWSVQNNNKRHPIKVSTRKYDLPTGVTHHNNKFIAGVTVKKKYYYLGLFTSAQEASLAYLNKLQELTGQANETK